MKCVLGKNATCDGICPDHGACRATIDEALAKAKRERKTPERQPPDLPNKPPYLPNSRKIFPNG